MKPVALVTAIVAALYIVGRGPLIVAPTATAAYYRRLLSTPGRVRLFAGLLAPLAIALIVTARQAHATQGGITMGRNGADFLTGGTSAGSTTIRAAFEKAREDDSIKAVVVRVDSPGGSALASDIMWEAATR